MNRPYTAGWRGPDGLVHITGTHTLGAVFTECGVVVAANAVHGKNHPPYEECLDVPTCILCLGQAVDYLPYEVFEEEGVAYINAAAISKINFDDD